VDVVSFVFLYPRESLVDSMFANINPDHVPMLADLRSGWKK
jgi:hypothetical protein